MTLNLAVSLHEFFGKDKPAAEGASAPRFNWIEMPETYVVFFLVLGVALGALWVYRRESDSVRTFWRMLCAVLRAAAIVTLLLILFQPALQSRTFRQDKTAVAVLIDTSLSMALRDVYEEEEDQINLALSCGLINSKTEFSPQVADTLKRMRRIDIVNALLKNDGKEFLQALFKDHPVRVYGFDKEVRDLPLQEGMQWPTKEGPLPEIPLLPLEPDAKGLRTEIGTALTTVLENDPTRNLGAVVVITDGRSNSGIKAEDVADEFGLVDIPVFTVGIGDYHSPKDIEVLNVNARDKIQVDDTLRVDVAIVGKGYPEQTAKLDFTIEKKKDLNTGQWMEFHRELASNPVTFTSGDARVDTNFIYTFHEDMLGEYEMRVEINREGVSGELDGEITKNNNYKIFRVEVVSRKLKVLYIEGYPRWEYRYLSRALMRDKKAVDFWAFLYFADRNWVQECSPGLKAVQNSNEFGTLKDLVKYDVVILGDVNPDLLPGEFQQSLVDFVRIHHGGVIFIAGEYYMPRVYRSSQIDEQLLPVVISTMESYNYGPIEKDFKPRLTAVGKSNPVTLLLGPEDFTRDNVTQEQVLKANTEFWEDNDHKDDGLPGIYWYYSDILRPTAGAEVLVEHPDSKLPDSKVDGVPIVVLNRVGAGRVAFLGTDDFWRWRFLVDDLYHYRFYTNLINFVTSGRLEGSKRFMIQIDKEKYDENEKVQITAQAISPDLRPYTDIDGEMLAEYPVTVTLADGSTTEIKLQAADKESDNGMYRYEFKPPTLGNFKFVIEDLGGAKDEEGRAEIAFEVLTKSLEDREPKMDKESLEKISQASTGMFHFPWELNKIPPKIDMFTARQEGNLETDLLWDSPFALTLLMVLVGLEWLIRRWQRLA